MKTQNNIFNISLLQIEEKLTDWFMNFFDEPDDNRINNKERQQNNYLYVFIEQPELLFTVLSYFLNKIVVIFNMNIASKVSRLLLMIRSFLFDKDIESIPIVNSYNREFTNVTTIASENN
jgi:hypothetical protein